MPSHHQVNYYQVTEPHPTASKYIYSGRGGAGNTFKAPKTSHGSTARGPASLFETGLPHDVSAKFSSGRGGAGNIHHTSAKPIFSFDEELERQSSRDKRMKEGGVWHVGRGGAGNYTMGGKERRDEMMGLERKDTESSVESNGSARSGFMQRLSGVFERR